jgi:SNF2 family DNA or RNA helicase
MVGGMLAENGILYCQVDGSLGKRQKTAALDDFRSNPNLTLLLITLGTGSTGLVGYLSFDSMTHY